MQNDELFEENSSLLDSITDSELDTQIDSIIEDSSFLVRDDSQTGSDENAVTPLDDSSHVCIISDNRDVIEEMQRIEGYTISILYMLYIGLALFISVVIVKMIYHFTKFN